MANSWQGEFPWQNLRLDGFEGRPRGVVPAAGYVTDATALCLDWHGGPPRDREATSGANREGRSRQGAPA
jgi:hypothetical protein